MSVLDTAKARSSVRAYTGQAVEEEKLLKILESAREFDTSVIKKVPLSLVIGLFFCQPFCFVI